MEYNKLLDMHKAIEFDDVTHTYVYKDRKIRRSVSTLVKQVFPFDQEQVLDRMVNSSGWKRSKYYATCGVNADTNRPITNTEVIKENIKRVWNDKVTLGKDVHALLERVFITGPDSQLQEERLRKEIEKRTDGRMDVDALKTLFDRYHWTPLQTECRMVDEKRNVAGTANLVLYDDQGELVIVDWKCSKILFDMFGKSRASEPMQYYASTNYWQCTMQLNMYRVIIEQVYGLRVSNTALICFDEEFSMSVYFVPRIKDVELWYLEKVKSSHPANYNSENTMVDCVGVDLESATS